MMTPLIPQYGAAALPNVVPSILVTLGVPDMTAVLGLPGARRVCLLLVDGLGWQSLRSREAEAPFLRRWPPRVNPSPSEAEGEPITAGFPATTANETESPIRHIALIRRTPNIDARELWALNSS